MRDSPNPSTVKTSAPSLVGVVERPRLIQALTQLTSPAKWLQSPSGTGKSTLAASYARSRARSFTWYRLDERDNDPAFFYEHFCEAVSAQLQLTEALPRFSADDHSRQQDFARRYFGALAAQIDRSVLLVIDDFHRLTDESMQLSIAAIVDVAGPSIEQLFISETLAPPAFFDAIAACGLALLNDADLHFTIEECKSMGISLRVDGAHCEDLAALTGGHASALRLACELLRKTGASSTAGARTTDRIHTHLLSKLLDGMPEQRRELLLRTAYVSHLTRPIAEVLAGREAAAQIDALVEAALLRRVGSDAAEVFEAHGLVRQGMQTLAVSRLGKHEARALAERSATALIDNDQREHAFALLLQIGSTSRAVELLADLAKDYAKRGHVKLLLASIEKLPEDQAHGNAWLCFWTGQALLSVDEERARDWLAKSYRAFEEHHDANGLRLAAASVVTAFGLEWGDLRELDLWMERHRRAGGDNSVPIGEPLEGTLLMGVACTALINGSYPKQIDTDAMIARLRQLLDTDGAWLSEDQRVQAARLLIDQGYVFARHELAQATIFATRPLIDQAAGSALHRGRWLMAAAYAHLILGDPVRSASVLGEAREIAQSAQSNRLSFELGLAFTRHWMRARDLSRAAEELDQLQAIASHAPPAQRAEHARLMARLLLLQERSVEGLKWAEEARRQAIPAGFKGSSLRAFDIELISALAANNQIIAAIDFIAGLDFEPYQYRLAMEHCLRFLSSNKSDLQMLRSGLRNAAEVQFVNLLERAPAALAELCESALAYDVETEFILGLIANKQLRPPEFAGPYWPWPVKVMTLGGFRLEIRGQRYQPTHKAQEKPLELLKLFLACQALGRDSVEKSWIAERLWPDAELDNARKSLDMTIGRLRKLLGSDETILLNEGRVQLSPLQVWTDIRPLRRALTRARTQRDDYVAHRVAEEAGETVAAVLNHYAGPFLGEEEGPAWLLAGREAIAAAVRQALLSADTLLNGSADERLVPALERALTADPTSEDLARALMRAQLRLGHNGEAIRVYRRIREMLSLLLSVAPSKDTEYLRDQAYDAEAHKESTSVAKEE